METWWDRKEVNNELQLQLHSILVGVHLASWSCRPSRRHSHPPRRRIPYSGGCSRHVTDITFNRATGPSATALYPSFQFLFLWPTGNHVLADDSCVFLLQVCCIVGRVRYSGTWTGSICLQFGTSSDGKEVNKELQLYK